MEEQHSPKRRKTQTTALAVTVEEKGQRWSVGKPFERTQDLDCSPSTFRIVTIDGGKTLNAELSILR